MPSYLFQSHQLAAFARYLAPDTLFAFDLDGTLAPIVEERSAASIAKPIKSALQRLSGLAKVVVLTGRSRKEAQSLLGFQPNLLIGNHGAEWPGEQGRNWRFVQLCLKWRETLHDHLFQHGVDIEFKGESISLHYRKAEDQDQALALIHEAVATLEPPPRVVGGKCVLNLLPPEAPGKGAALALAMERLGCTRAVYFGDDETDEEVFRLKRDDVFGVHIGEDGQSAAAYHLKQQSEMLGLLNSIVGTLEAALEQPEDKEAAND